MFRWTGPSLPLAICWNDRKYILSEPQKFVQLPNIIYRIGFENDFTLLNMSLWLPTRQCNGVYMSLGWHAVSLNRLSSLPIGFVIPHVYINLKLHSVAVFTNQVRSNLHVLSCWNLKHWHGVPLRHFQGFTLIRLRNSSPKEESECA